MAANGKTVLLVEDNEDNRIVYSTILRHFGYSVTEALNGEEGIAKARSEKPDHFDVRIGGFLPSAAASAVATAAGHATNRGTGCRITVRVVVMAHAVAGMAVMNRVFGARRHMPVQMMVHLLSMMPGMHNRLRIA